MPDFRFSKGMLIKSECIGLNDPWRPEAVFQWLSINLGKRTFSTPSDMYHYARNNQYLNESI